MPITDQPFAEKRYLSALGSKMAYIDVSSSQDLPNTRPNTRPDTRPNTRADTQAAPHTESETFVFLHGNPTSSYLWRAVMPHCNGIARLLAPDLIGMGDSDKLPNSGVARYTFAEHSRYLDALLEKLDIGNSVTLILHDWGSALGFDWARRHPERIKALVYMEAIVRPVTWDEWPEHARKVFQGFRSESGESMILEKNVFIERVLPSSIIRKLTETEMTEYRRPFLRAGEDRRPTLTWPRQIPIDEHPADVVSSVNEYSSWLSQSDLPKLFINAEPGSILVGAQREYCRTWPNQQEVTVAGTHFIQEDSPDEIGLAIRQFHQSIVMNKPN